MATAKATSAPWVEFAKVGVGGLALLGVTAVLQPIAFAGIIAGALSFASSGVSLALCGGVYWWACQYHKTRATYEDWACGTYITGVPGSGKTRLAYLQVREFCRYDYGWIWVSIKSSQSLLPHLPAQVRDSCLLFMPHSEHPLGFNFLRTYLPAASPGASTERELLADQTAELFSRMHSAMSSNMRELIRMGVLALLMWSARVEAEVTLWEIYRLFQEEAFRAKVLSAAPKPVRDAFSADEARKTTLQAVRVQLRRSVTSENLLVALSQRDGIDLWDVMENGRRLVCDTPEALLGPAVAPFLCQVIASRVQMLTSRRPPGAKPFGFFADEFQRYTNPTFAQGIETGREYGLAWFLIHQTSAGQDLGSEVRGAVAMCQNRYYFQQTTKDAKAAAEAFAGRWAPEEFAFLPARRFKAIRRIQGKPIVFEGRTPDIGAANPDIAVAILERNATGPSRKAILKEITSRKVGSNNGDNNGDGADAAESAV